jgi:hypothetical protein
MPGSVCRHLKIASRVITSRLFHVISQQPRKLQHIQIISFFFYGSRGLVRGPPRFSVVVTSTPIAATTSPCIGVSQ